MEFIKDTFQTLKRMNYRQLLQQGVQLGERSACKSPLQLSANAHSVLCVSPMMPSHALPLDPGLIVTSALMIWKSLMLVTGSESPVSCAPSCSSDHGPVGSA